MKQQIFALPLVIFLIVGCTKSKDIQVQGRYKARFEINAICANYTFSVIEGNIDVSYVETSWTNPQTNKAYTNAFGIANPCELPDNLKEGDEFYFGIINPEDAKSCIVCAAYYPSPQKKLNIKILN